MYGMVITNIYHKSNVTVNTIERIMTSDEPGSGDHQPNTTSTARESDHPDTEEGAEGSETTDQPTDSTPTKSDGEPSTYDSESASTSTVGAAEKPLSERLPVDRRTVLGGAALSLGSGTLGYLLAGGPPTISTSDEVNGNGENGDDEGEHLPFDVWTDVQGTFREAPSHIPGRAASLVTRALRREEIAEERSDDDADDITVHVTEDDSTAAETNESLNTVPTKAGLGTLSGGSTVGSGITYAANEDDESAFEEFEPDTISEEVLVELFEFVRDNIHTVPTTRDDIGNVIEGIRWGGRGALRCGMGTPRDKAEALAHLYRKSGFTAVVHKVDVDVEEAGLTAEEVREDMLNPPDWYNESPDFDDEIEEWAERLDREIPDESEATLVDENGEESRAIGESLAEYLPEEPSSPRRGPDDFDWRWNASSSSMQAVPIVEVFDDNHERYVANLFADVPFDETGSDEDLEMAAEPDVETVRVTMSAAKAGDLDNRFDLVSSEWEVPDLIGRQLLVRTGPIVNPIENPLVGIEDMDMFIPSLIVQDPHLDDEEQADLSEMGDMFTISGDTYGANVDIEDGDIVMEDETITRNGELFYDPEEAPDPAKIDTLEVEADPADYPRVRLNVTALDEEGAPVAGLPSSVFGAYDDETPVAPTLAENQPQPQIRYLIDDSGSMSSSSATDYATDEERYDELQTLIEEVAPNATIERETVDSAMWTHLPEAAADSPDLIIYAHDGEPAVGYNEGVDSVLEHAPPTLLLSAYDKEAPVEDEVVLQQAELADADVAPMGEWDMVRDAVEDAVASLDPPTYRLDYGVTADEFGTREVELLVGNEPIEDPHMEATTTYHADGDATGTGGSGSGTVRTLAGLYLTIEYGGEEVTRTLGGYDPTVHESWDPYDDAPDEEAGFGRPGLADFAEDTKMALLGGVDLSFEGDGILAPVIFDDMLEARQSYQRVDELADEYDYDEELEMGGEAHEALVETINEGTMQVQWDPSMIQSPLPNRINENGLTYFVSPRMVMSQTKPVLEEDTAFKERRLDILPFTRAATAADDGDERFFRTLERTARMSLFEDTLYDSATLSLIGDSDLVYREDLSDHDVDSNPYHDLRERANRSRNDYQLAPRDGSELAMWNVDVHTGTVVGLMPDGSGGAVKRERMGTFASGRGDALDLFNEIMDQIDCCDVAGSGAQGKVARYFEVLAAMYARVTAIIGSMRPDASPRGIIGGAIIDVAIDEATDHWIFDFWEAAEATGM